MQVELSELDLYLIERALENAHFEVRRQLEKTKDIYAIAKRRDDGGSAYLTLLNQLRELYPNH